MITAPVSLNEVSALLESNNQLVQTCKSVNVNPWAKYKPIAWPCSVFNRATKTINGYKWWQGIDGGCGWLAPAEYSSVGSFIASSDVWTRASLEIGKTISSAQKTAWGTTDDMWSCRLGDFDGYNHAAVSPFGSQPQCASVFRVRQTDSNIRFLVTSLIPITLPENNLTLADFGFGSYFFGIIITNVDGRSIGIVSNSRPISQSTGYAIDVLISTGRVGSLTEGSTYRAYPAMFANAVPEWSPLGSGGSYIRIPGVTDFYYTFKVVGSGTVVADVDVNLVSATYSSETGAYIGRLYYKNRSSSSATINSFTLYIKNGSVNKASKSIASVTVPAGGEVYSPIFMGTTDMGLSSLSVSGSYTGTSGGVSFSNTVTGYFLMIM